MRTTPRRAARAVGLAALVGVLTGCAGPVASGSAPADVPADAATYRCLDLAFPADALAAGRTADTLDVGRPALEGVEVPVVDAAEWVVVEEGESRVALLRELEVPDDSLGDGHPRTHQRLVIEVLDGDTGWMLTASGTCALHRELDGLPAAALALDPRHPADPASTRLHLLVQEDACASGGTAEGRVRLVELVEDGPTVDLAVVVDPLDTASCPAHPPTPFVVELSAPLGPRTVRDVGLVPTRDLTTP
ncbi:hypothetical protein [Cellulomonas cellasea]|uniref:Lipoprotein n=1 Tax=Cellulomonas cellasea TaxID=43670 RepID=A0A7W4UFU9_9CELL|nr:hypothetical protein [Cellulomonas cellasea]MBB2923412.1 hypothetical protein [Cellulomonas cellasea]